MWLKRGLTITVFFGVAFTIFAGWMRISVSPLVMLPLLVVLSASASLLLIDYFIPGQLEHLQKQLAEDRDDPSTLTASVAYLAGSVFPPVAGGSVLGLVMSTLVRLLIVETFTLIAVSIGGGVLIGMIMGQIGFALRIGIITMLVVGLATAGIAIAFLFFAFLGMAWSFTVYLLDWGDRRSDGDL